METDLHRSLEWIAVAHFSTEHPHVHVALRGLDRTGAEFRLDRDYVRNGLRSVAEHFATVQLPDFPGYLQVAADASRPGPGRFAALREQSIAARLMTLETMGLARADGSHRWRVRTDLEIVLRTMQRAADHQKTLAVNGALLSDPRLQLCAPSWKEMSSIQGRVLSHGEEETGNRYLLLEGTVGRVYYLSYTPELDDARSRGDLATNTFVEIRKTLDESRKRRITVMNLGDADALNFVQVRAALR